MIVYTLFTFPAPRQRLVDCLVAAETRLATHSPALSHSQQQRHVPATVATEATAHCASLSEALHRDISPMARRIVADFKPVAASGSGGGSRPHLVLLWAAAPPAAGPLPATLLPASAPVQPLPETESAVADGERAEIGDGAEIVGAVSCASVGQGAGRAASLPDEQRETCNVAMYEGVTP